MSINFATLQALDIPEGKVVEIKDASGRVIWAVQNSIPVVLQVEKITATTYSGGTSYTDEQFVLINIYPKTNGKVNVTYGGLTKTITDTSGAEKPNAQQVLFGTFNGVSDSAATPASGELTIEGNYYAFGVGSYKADSKGTTSYCNCITAIKDWGSVNEIPTYAFSRCNLASIDLSTNIKVIGEYAFNYCQSLTSVSLPNGLETLGDRAFYYCEALPRLVIGSDIKYIGSGALLTKVKDFEVIVNGQPEEMKEEPFGRTGTSGGDGKPSIRFYCDNWSWDKWANCDSHPYTRQDIIESTGGSTKTEYKVYINDVYTKDITNVELKECTKIGAYAFYDFNITSITIPKSVTLIGDWALYIPSVNNLNVNVLATTPPTLGESVFYNINYISTITVPKGCGATYKVAEGWSTYADKIVEAS